jgi:hypothetical protein
MCIIAYKPENVKMPEYETLRTCFENNDDGAGYMFAYGGKVRIVKGLMTFSDFIISLDKAVARYGEKLAFVLHFRWSTQAGVRRDCTHPFPLSKSMTDLRKLTTECEIGIAHNGIISLTSSFKKDITYSDTMEFIADYLSLIIKTRDYHKSADTLRLIERLSESKLAILDGGGHCELTGGDWLLDNGVYYSNDGYLPLQMQVRRAFLNSEAYLCPAYVDGDDSYCCDCPYFSDCYPELDDGKCPWDE